MKLAAAYTYYDTEDAYDAYTAALLFKCQFSSFNDATSSGATARRRVLGVAPTTVLPARKVIRLFGDAWIAGDNTADGFKGREIRHQVNLKKATGLFSILTPGEACLASAGVSAYAALAYYKESLNTITSTELDIFWNIFFSTSETVVKGAFLKYGSILYRVRTTYVTDDKYLIAESDELDVGSRKALVFTSNGVLNVATDTYGVISTSTYGIALEMPKYYKLRDAAEVREAPGDFSVFVAKSAVTPVVNSTFTMDSKTWRVLAVVDEGDAWALHARRT